MTRTEQYPRVHRVNRPLVVGEILLVPCSMPVLDEHWNEAIPVLWPPHHDNDDGQPEWHVHLDTRFNNNLDGPLRFVFPGDRPIKWLPLPVLRTEVSEISMTPVEMISGAIKELSCTSIVNGRCPHRGFNLAQVKPDAHGVITCPLHGMRFNAFTGKGLPDRRFFKPDYTEEELWLRG